MSVAALRDRLVNLAGAIAGRTLDRELEDWLNREVGPGSTAFSSLRQACETGVREGWLCDREHGGIKFGRIFKPADDLAVFSVDVVEMTDVKGPHHRHPGGEIDMIMPVDDGAEFDGQGEGWLVYGPGSAHHPTVAGGRALVLYLLPGGEIEFTGSS